MTDDEPTTDEQAVTALFAALVKDSPPSEVSPLEVVRLGKAETRAAQDKRIARLKFTRNALVAAAVIAVIAVIVPHLGNSSTNTAASLSSGSSSTAALAAAAPNEADAGRSPVVGSGGPGAVTSAAASSGSVAAGAVKAPAAGSPAAASPLASSAAASGAAAAPGPPTSTDKNFDTSSGASCTLLPAPAVAAARTAFPAGYFGAAGPVADCAGRYGATLAAGAGHAADLTIAVAASADGACRPPGDPAGPVCSPVPGTKDAYQRTSPHGTSVWVYGGGYQVILAPSADGLSVDRLIAAGRAVIKAIG